VKMRHSDIIPGGSYMSSIKYQKRGYPLHWPSAMMRYE
jgi:hypothetical protein